MEARARDASVPREQIKLFGDNVIDYTLQEQALGSQAGSE